MKLMIFLFLLALFLPLGAQLRTRYTPLPALSRVRRRMWAAPVGRKVFFVGYMSIERKSL
jgi:hypothetical protein